MNLIHDLAQMVQKMKISHSYLFHEMTLTKIKSDKLSHNDEVY
jgi:hypothetical protein